MPGTGTGRPSNVGRLFGPVSGMSAWLRVEWPCGRRRIGNRATLIGAGPTRWKCSSRGCAAHIANSGDQTRFSLSNGMQNDG